MRIATVDYVDGDKRPVKKTLSASRYTMMKGDVKALIDTSGALDIKDVERAILIGQDYAKQWGARGNDVIRTIKELEDSGNYKVGEDWYTDDIIEESIEP